MAIKKAILALADGTVFEGRAIGHEGETCGEVVFNTAMTGYQEILTDPSYRGQIVTMTCPQIGNYGVTSEDSESRRIWAEGFIVKESSRITSNWRSELSLDEYLKQAHVVGIEGLDTRALTRHLRDGGSQQGYLSHVDLDQARGVERARTAPGIVGRDLVADVTCASPYAWTESSGVWNPEAGNGAPSAQSNHPGWHRPAGPFRIVAYDFGIKQNILRRLVDVGCSVTVVPASTPAARVKAMDPDGLLFSNGPGDPEGVPYAVAAIRDLIGWRPILGICLGHQLLGLALGLQTFKLKFGHHGGNHPVMDLRSRKVEITSQNHNFSVRVPAQEGTRGQPATGQGVLNTPFGRVSVSHVSLNDESVEGMQCLDVPVLSVQYHPEAAPGPHDSAYLFRQFVQMMESRHA